MLRTKTRMVLAAPGIDLAGTAGSCQELLRRLDHFRQVAQSLAAGLSALRSLSIHRAASDGAAGAGFLDDCIIIPLMRKHLHDRIHAI